MTSTSRPSCNRHRPPTGSAPIRSGATSSSLFADRRAQFDPGRRDRRRKSGCCSETALGLLAAARRGWVEEVVMRIADFHVSRFPAILSAIMLTAVFGAGIVNAIIAIGIFNIPIFIRVTRASANSVWARGLCCWLSRGLRLRQPAHHA